MPAKKPRRLVYAEFQEEKKRVRKLLAKELKKSVSMTKYEEDIVWKAEGESK